MNAYGLTACLTGTRDTDILQLVAIAAPLHSDLAGQVPGPVHERTERGAEGGPKGGRVRGRRGPAPRGRPGPPMAPANGSHPYRSHRTRVPYPVQGAP